MEDRADSSLPLNQHPPAAPETTAGSGLKIKLKLPALKNGKIIKPPLGPVVAPPNDVQEKKPARPVKLKPLKEVLTRLITQIKKKDDYVFFMKPVDVATVPGYLDIIQNPMDLGTMTRKVEKGRYRSLDEFATDFRLVTGNAKRFNPPGSIYYTEAERIEAYGLDQIAKAAPTVIQYETDWNIDIEKDDDDGLPNNDVQSNLGSPVDDDATSRMGRSPSVLSQAQPGPSRRTRGLQQQSKKPTESKGISESIDVEGRMPGSKDGLGAFPPGSDWAATMLKLKLKGKRYKTKKERMKIEKEGLPHCTDGSLDYTEMEDPFTVLSAFVPDPPSRPYFSALYPPPNAHVEQPPGFLSAAGTPPPPPPPDPYPKAINIPPTHHPPEPLYSGLTDASGSKRRHWVVSRNQSRTKLKDKEGAGADGPADEVEDVPAWQIPREAHAADFGSLSVLAGILAEELALRGQEGQVMPVVQEEEGRAMQVLKASLDAQENERRRSALAGSAAYQDTVWTDEAAAAAEEYIKDVVYGGVEGFAYVRSLAEFVKPPPRQDFEGDEPSTPEHSLGMPLANWAETNIVDRLTDGHHALLRDTALHLSGLRTSVTGEGRVLVDGNAGRTISQRIEFSLRTYPKLAAALQALTRIGACKLDMASLIYTQQELYVSEEVWEGKLRKTQAQIKQETDDAFAMDVDGDGSKGKEKNAMLLEDSEDLGQVLDFSANLISEMDRAVRERVGGKAPPSAAAAVFDAVKPLPPPSPTIATSYPDDTNGATEDSSLRRLRLNLLALAKRAPIDMIAPIPRDLVPEEVRHLIPTCI